MTIEFYRKYTKDYLQITCMEITPFLLSSSDNKKSKELGSKGVAPEGARRIPSLLHSFDNKNGNCVNLPKTLWHVK
jgi:hypothetical protein